MPKLVLRRGSAWADRFRKYVIVVDGKKVGALRNGETLVIPIERGDHTLQARIDWCGSEIFKFSTSEADVVFDVSGRIRGWRLLFAIAYLFMPRRWIDLKRGS